MSDLLKKLSNLIQIYKEYGPDAEKYLDYDEKKLLNRLDLNIFKTSLDEFELSARLANVLKIKELNTIEDVLIYGLNNLLRSGKNFGRKSLIELSDTIESYIVSCLLNHPQKNKIKTSEYSMSTETNNKSTNSKLINLTYYLDTLLPSFIKKNHMQILRARYCYDSPKKATLEKIANANSLTREGVRQTIKKLLSSIKHPSKLHYLEIIIKHLDQALIKYSGILDIHDLNEEPFFSGNTRIELRFLINIVSDLFRKKYKLINKEFLCNLNDNEQKHLKDRIMAKVCDYKYPLDKNKLIQLVMTDLGTLSRNYVYHYLINEVKSEIMNNQFISIGAITIDQRVRILLNGIKKPLHINDIARIYASHYGRSVSGDNESRALGERLRSSTDFIMVGPRTFMLRKYFQLPSNIDQIIRLSKSILKRLNDVTDTKYLIHELRKMNVDLDCINQYSLKDILLEYPGFISYRKFEVGLVGFKSVDKRTPLEKMLYDLLLSHGAPMTVSEIYAEISKKRGYEKYIIDQRLGKEPKFIRIDTATYTVKENIPNYKNRCEHIIKFIKEKLLHNNNSISLSVAKRKVKNMVGTDELTKGLILHVLETYSGIEK